ncbi:MAG: hypothetical protein ACRDXC_07505 [Acidimicrobiales bacterium]
MYVLATSHLFFARRLDEVDRNETTELRAVALLDDEVRDRAFDGIDDDTHQLPARSFLAEDLGSRSRAGARAPRGPGGATTPHPLDDSGLFRATCSHAGPYRLPAGESSSAQARRPPYFTRGPGGR